MNIFDMGAGPNSNELFWTQKRLEARGKNLIIIGGQNASLRVLARCLGPGFGWLRTKN
jgi:hypothetical protein